MDPNRVPQLATTYDGRSVTVPQAYHDLVAANLADPLEHPVLGPFTHTAVKSGRWSDPTLWSAGTVPGAGAVVSLGGFDVTYDAESDAILKDVLGPIGSTFRVDSTKDTRHAGGTINYEGDWVDIDWSEDVPAFSTNVYVTMASGGAASAQPSKDVMGPWTLHATNTSQAILRSWAPRSRADLPVPYPKVDAAVAAANFGARMPAGSPAVPLGGTPYFVLGDGVNGAASAGLNLTLSAGAGRSQGAYYGIIRDSLGDCRFPDSQSIETYPNNLSVKSTPFNVVAMQPEQLVERLGCWMDGATPKLRMWFMDRDRLTHVPFTFHIDWTLQGFPADFLAQHMRPQAPAAPNATIRPEVVPAPAPLGGAEAAPAIRSRTSLEVVSGEALAHKLRADQGLARWSIQGGADAAQFAVSGGVLTWAANGTRSTATPQDLGGDNVYDVVIRCRSLFGEVTDVAHKVRVLPSARTFATISDDFNRADENLEANSAYVRLAGTEGQLAIRSNRVQVLASSLGTVYDLGSLGSSQQRATATFAGGSTARVLMRMVDEQNWIGFSRQDFPGARLYVQMCVNGVATTLAGFNNVGAVEVSLFDDRLLVTVSNNANGRYPLYPRDASALVVPQASDGQTVVGALKLPPDAPRGHKVGLRGGDVLNAWLDSVVFTRLPS